LFNEWFRVSGFGFQGVAASLFCAAFAQAKPKWILPTQDFIPETKNLKPKTPKVHGEIGGQNYQTKCNCMERTEMGLQCTDFHGFAKNEESSVHFRPQIF
jgi:hypothetical protein